MHSPGPHASSSRAAASTKRSGPAAPRCLPPAHDFQRAAGWRPLTARAAVVLWQAAGDTQPGQIPRTPRSLTFSVSLSFTVGSGVLVDILLHFTSAQCEGETKQHGLGGPATASSSALRFRSGAAEGGSPPPQPSRSRAGPGPSLGGSRGSCSPGPGGRAEEPRGRRWRGRAGGGGGLQVGPPASPRLRAARGPGPLRLLVRPRPSHRGFQRRGLHTAPPAAPEEEDEEDVDKVESKTGRRALRAPTMEGAAEAALSPGCSALSGSLAASASTRWPPPLPVPRSLTDPRWPPLGFLCCLRMPEVTAPPPPGARPISVARGSLTGCCC